jgi:hypothetical protein
MGTSVQNVAETHPGDSLNELCLRYALDAIDRAAPEPLRPAPLIAAMVSARARLMPQRP